MTTAHTLVQFRRFKIFGQERKLGRGTGRRMYNFIENNFILQLFYCIAWYYLSTMPWNTIKFSQGHRKSKVNSERKIYITKKRR